MHKRCRLINVDDHVDENSLSSFATSRGYMYIRSLGLLYLAKNTRFILRQITSYFKKKSGKTNARMMFFSFLLFFSFSVFSKQLRYVSMCDPDSGTSSVLICRRIHCAHHPSKEHFCLSQNILRHIFFFDNSFGNKSLTQETFIFPVGTNILITAIMD